MIEHSLSGTPSESHYHKVIKSLLYNHIFENNKFLIQRSLEKYFGNRFADVYFKFKNGKEVVVEVQNSPISVKEIIQRTNDYNKRGVYVLWILFGEGKCVASPKSPRDSKEIKISMAENFLHKMYGGRVYYINLKVQKGKLSISDLFALHFIKPFKKKKRSLYKGKFAHFYIRDAIHTPITRWTILCNDFARNKIARFYDKNIKSLLKESIKNLSHTQSYKKVSSKKLISLILHTFKKKYGKCLIYKCLIELYNEKEINLNKKFIEKALKKIS